MLEEKSPQVLDKIALVFHGKIGGMTGHNGLGEMIDFKACAKTIKHNIIKHYDCDIFMHSWDEQFKDELINTYNPKSYLFQPQEYFGYTEEQLRIPRRDPIQDAGSLHQGFRTTSRFVSLQRAMNLKKQYEQIHNFEYKWVIVMRYDLVIFNKLDLLNCNREVIYADHDPNWNWFQGIIFLGNSTNMDKLGDTINHIQSGKYNPTDIHAVERKTIQDICNNDTNKFGQYIFKRFQDIEIYRQVLQPETCLPRGDGHGALSMPSRFFALIQEIDSHEKN